MDGDEVKTEEIKLSPWTQGTQSGEGSAVQPHNSVRFASLCGRSAPHGTHRRRIVSTSAHFIPPRRSPADASSGRPRPNCVRTVARSWEQAGFGPYLAPPGSRPPALPHSSRRMVPGRSRGAAGPGCPQPDQPCRVSLARAQFGGSRPRRWQVLPGGRWARSPAQLDAHARVRVASRARSQRGEGARARPGALQGTGAAESGARNFAGSAAEIRGRRQPAAAGAGGRGGAGVPWPESLGGGVFPPRWPKAAGHSRLLLLRPPPPPPPRRSGRRRSPRGRRRRRRRRRGQEEQGVEDGAPGRRGGLARTCGGVLLLPRPALEEPAAGGRQEQGRRGRARWGPRAPHCGHPVALPATPGGQAGRTGRRGWCGQQVERLQETEASAGPRLLLLPAQPVLLLAGASRARQRRQSGAGVRAAPADPRAFTPRGQGAGGSRRSSRSDASWRTLSGLSSLFVLRLILPVLLAPAAPEGGPRPRWGCTASGPRGALMPSEEFLPAGHRLPGAAAGAAASRRGSAEPRGAADPGDRRGARQQPGEWQVGAVAG